MLDKAKARTTTVQAPLMPTYAEVAHAIRLLDAEPVQRVRRTMDAIREQTGTPQNPVDWTDPETWIEARLTGEAATLARKIWIGSGQGLNPRYLYGLYLYINRLALLDQPGGIYLLGERGQRFLASDEAILRELDAVEGFPKLLSLVAERSPCRRGDLLPAWGDYLKAVSLFSTTSTFNDTLRRRLVNLMDRGLISRTGNTYAITDQGLEWLKGFSLAQPNSAAAAAAPSAKRTSVAEAALAHNEEQLEALRRRLMALEAVQFEHFVRELLEKMDYEDVRVTKLTGDKGVDVIAKVQFGITEITEVVQVKRTEGTISRPIIDALRGALPYHKAIRGTIISLGEFAKGAKEGALFPGAAPITLIDGRRLLDLCMKHQVGLKRQPVEIYEVDEAFFAEKFTRTEAGDIPVEEAEAVRDEERLA